MTILSRSAILSTLVFAALAISLPAAAQVAQPRAPSATLPEIFVAPGVSDARHYSPYTSGAGPRASSMNNIVAPHYQVPAGYDADVAMHPYTSGIGPCTEGAAPSQGCRHPTGHPIESSHYERMPFMR